MKDLALTWDFLIRHSPESYLVPSPWHLLLVLFLLGVLAATGLHHLAGQTYQLYLLRGRTSPWLAFPSLGVFLVSVQVIVGAYLFAGQAEGVVGAALSAPVRKPTIEAIGKALLEPAFANPPGRTTETPDMESGLLGKRLLAFSEESLREKYLLRLAEQEQEVLRRKQSEREVHKKGFDPPGALEAPPAEPSARLSALALRWVTNPAPNWPGGQLHPLHQQPDPGGKPGEGKPPEAEPEPGGSVPAVQPPAVETPPGKNGESRWSQEETFPIQLFVAGLVAEIRPGAALGRKDWEYVAGTRFVEWVLEPTLVWQVRYLALLILVLVLAFDVLYIFFLLQLRRWLPAPERRRRSNLIL